MSWLSSAIGTVTGAKGAQKQAGLAQQNIQRGQDLSANAINSTYGSAMDYLDPMAVLFHQNVGNYTDQAQNGLQGADQRNAMLGQLAQQYPELGLPEFSFNMQEDPVYQFQQQQMENALARRMAAGGQLNSSDMNNSLTRGTMELAGRYGNDMFNRAAQSYGMNYGRQMDLYGAGVDRSNTQFGRGQQLFGNDMALADNRFNRLAGVVGLGAQGRNALGTLMQNKGGALSNIYSGTQNSMADINMDIGGMKIATSPLNMVAALGSTAARAGGK